MTRYTITALDRRGCRIHLARLSDPELVRRYVEIAGRYWDGVRVEGGITRSIETATPLPHY